MHQERLQLSLTSAVNFKNTADELQSNRDSDQIAGFIQNGKYGWIAYDSVLEIVSSETGVRAAYYNFIKNHSSKNPIITQVEEIDHLSGVCILAVAVEFASGTGGGMISILCVQGAKILGSMDFCEKITSIRNISKDACRKSVLKKFRGCIAIGTDQGKLFLLDLMLPNNVHEIVQLANAEATLFMCHNILADIEQKEIELQHRTLCRDSESSDKTYFSIQLEVLIDSSPILSILVMPNLFTMAVGLHDGRMVLYNLQDLRPFHLAHPINNRSPLTHMSHIEPTDDPRCVVYVWAFHKSNDGAISVMHSLMFEKKTNSIYEDFVSCGVRLTMPMFVKESVPVCCRSIRKVVNQDEEDILTLNLLAWSVPSRKTTTMLLFDLNQWYKMEMPSVGDWRTKPKYVSVFEKEDTVGLDTFISESSVFPFNSILRPEEHFYPNSLSFEVSFLENQKFSHYKWVGIQSLVLQQFNTVGPQMILEPNVYFNEIMQVAISPQFYEVNFNAATPIEMKREFLLSVALEYNFNGFLKKCAWAWADGSYLGKDASVGLSLSTLTDWIWNRVRSIKEVCNSLCRPLFDYSEQRIDYGTQKMLSQCCKQLKTLSELLQIIIKDYQKYIPENINIMLKSQYESIKMASDYQEVLQWLLNVGLLPEGQWRPESRMSQDFVKDLDEANEFLIVPFPYSTINTYYMTQRMKLADDYITNHRGVHESSCPHLFIDTFIEQECNVESLKKLWRDNGGTGLYPPSSIQTLLRTLLVPNITIENKYVLFVYLFMDINAILNEGSKGIYSSIVQNLIKFPAVFKLNPAVIKRTQAFWNLDNGHLETAVEELISPLSHDKHLLEWQRELLIGTLLKQNGNNLALRALRSPGNPISSELEMETLLANNLLAEALKVQRGSGDETLLVKLFEKILRSAHYEMLLDLSLTEAEGLVLREYLEHSKNVTNCVNLHFVFLLQRAKFIDAVSLIDSMSQNGNVRNLNLEPPKEVLSAYHATMEPTTRQLTYMTYTDREKFQSQLKEFPSPLSTNLIQSKFNVNNNIYQKSIQCITEAAYEKGPEVNELPFIGCPKLGIFEYKQPQIVHDEIPYPLEINEHGKRKIDTGTREQKVMEPIFRLEDYEAPNQKKRKLNESIVSRKSYKDSRINMLTSFKEMKPNFNFTLRTNTETSTLTTPEKNSLFLSNILNTPVIMKRTPPERKLLPPAVTPHSILKSRSCRSSVSPTPSRFSEFEDNKSVKSITFAQLPDTRESSFNDSQSLNLDDSIVEEKEERMEDESMENEQPLNSSIMSSSNDTFFSPVTSPSGSIVRQPIASTSGFFKLDGPKPRKPISPTSKMTEKIDAIFNKTSDESFVLPAVPEVAKEDKPEDMETSLDETIGQYEPLRRGSVLRDTSDDESANLDSSVADDSIMNFVRKSVLKDTDDSSSASEEKSEEDSQSELPINRSILNSDSDDNSSAVDNFEDQEALNEDDGFEYGNVDFNDDDDDEDEDDDDQDIEDDEDVQNDMEDSSQGVSKDSDVIEIISSEDEEAPMQSTSYQELKTVTSVGKFVFKTHSPSSLAVEFHEDDQFVSQVVFDGLLYDGLQAPVQVNEEVVEESIVQDPEIDVRFENEIIHEVVMEEEVAPIVEEVAPLVEEVAPLVEEVAPLVEEVPVVEEVTSNAMEVEDADIFKIPEPVIAPEEVPIVEEQICVQKIVYKCGDDEIPVEESANVEESSNAEENRAENVSMMSEDCSFVSAADTELNNAVFVSHQTTSARTSIESFVSYVSTMETSILNNPAVFESTSEEIVDTTNVPVTTSEEQMESEDLNEAAVFESTSTEETAVEESVDDTLNKGLIEEEATEEVSKAENVTEQSPFTPENVTELSPFTPENATNLLNVAQMTASSLEMDSEREDREVEHVMSLTTPVKRSTRAKSVVSNYSSSTIDPRNLRPKSVTKVDTPILSPRIRNRRVSSDDPKNPKNLLKEKLLEKIDEQSETPKNTSQIVTRRRSQLIDSADNTPQTPTRMTRRNSVLSEDGGTPTSARKVGRRTSTDTPDTPRRLTRALSKEVLEKISPEVIGKAKIPPRNTRKRAGSMSDDDDAKSEISLCSGRSIRSTIRRTVDPIMEEVSPSTSKSSPKRSKSRAESVSSTDRTPEDGVSNEMSMNSRRLTRSQLAVMEKSRLLTERFSTEAKNRQSQSEQGSPTKQQGDSDEEDNVSVKSGQSTSSKVSKKRGRPRKNAKATEDDASSIASSKKGSPESPNWQKLSMIPEELSHIDEAGEPGRSMKKKGNSK